MKRYVVMFMMMYCNLSVAQNGSLSLALPSSPGSYQSDRFRAGDLDCSMAIGSGTNVEFGVMGIINNNQAITTYTSPGAKEVGVYGRITIPIGAPKGRIDCTVFYDLELTKRRLEIQKLENEINNLKNLKFENSTK